MGQKVLLFYIYAMTILTFSICGADKFAAQRQRRRVPEKVLFLLSALGGSVGMYLGMITFRHKTKHWYFVDGIPLIILVQAAILFYFFRLFYFVFFGRFILLFSVLSLPTIHSALAKFFFNSKKLVILSHSVRARRRTGFNLSGIHADCNVCNRSVFRFT